MPRLPTGLKRTVPVVFNVTVDEDEWLTRKAFYNKKSKAQFIVAKIFPKNTTAELARLRAAQKKVDRIFRREHYDGRG